MPNKIRTTKIMIECISIRPFTSSVKLTVITGLFSMVFSFHCYNELIFSLNIVKASLNPSEAIPESSLASSFFCPV